MGNTHHYRSVSGDESAPLGEKAKFSSGRSGWGKMSILMTVVLSGLVLTIIGGIAATVGSAAFNYTQDASTTKAAPDTAADAAAVVGVPSAAAVEPVTVTVSTTVLSTVPTTVFSTVTASPTANVANHVLNETSQDLAVSDPSLMTGQVIEDCGNNPEQARANGCVFDVMMQLWTPQACFDEVLSNRFLEVGNWTWYADPSAEKIFSLEEMRKGEHSAVFVAQDYHKTHCIYAWEKLVRAMRNQDPLIMELISYDHVIHCRHKTLQRTDGDTVRGVRAPTGYTRCAPFGTWIHNLPPNEHSSVD